MRGIQVRPIRILQKFHGQICCGIGCERGTTPGLETPITPDEPDVLDADDVVDGGGGGGLAAGSTSWVAVYSVYRPTA